MEIYMKIVGYVSMVGDKTFKWKSQGLKG